jgi:ssRNA-specific RNase YbeY (16S rRNA maturation enzyme)
MLQIQNNGFPFKKGVLLRILRQIANQLHIKGAVTVKIAADEEVRELNKKYRQKNCTTDVLSFPLCRRHPDLLDAGREASP